MDAKTTTAAAGDKSRDDDFGDDVKSENKKVRSRSTSAALRGTGMTTKAGQGGEEQGTAGTGAGGGHAGPCGACKFLRRKCISGCIFSPYFGSDQGAARFAAVHKVFGASNVSKLLLHIPANRRQDAVVTISYEAQARLSDPVYGCVSTIVGLQQQVASLQAELSLVQAQLMKTRLVGANALQAPLQQQQIAPPSHPHHPLSSLVTDSGYTANASPASYNLLHPHNNFSLSFDLLETIPTSRTLEQLRISHLSTLADGDEEVGREQIVFAEGILERK
ncbi:hypothetical protein H6P81_004987 [Aristolochia fimbriata]|uniref:LOB domain-containing protein n=1 Tax=Aristolochia fimbriata TaxID=158543 RepID=A0AAV7ETQ0_ARIFI|nr:hypothetical protein H6P81_004987 [Aristolochia fimbriata]